MDTYIPQNIIVRMPNWLGDAVMGAPILADLKQHWPEAKLTAMCQGHVGSLFTEDPHLDELLNFTRPSGWIHRQVHGEIIEPLRCGQYDLGILLTNSFSSAWWFWRGNIKKRVGYATHWRSLLLTDPIPIPKTINSQHLVETYKMLLTPLGIPLSSSTPKLYLSAEEKEKALQWLNNQGIFSDHIIVGINPGAAYGSAKCWLPDRFQKVAEQLLENPKIFILFFGDKSGLSLNRDICENFPERVINLAGKTSIRELLALLSFCKVLLTNDSGPMHMASALDVPVVALFGSTHDALTGPSKNGIVIHKHVECSPCYKRVCPIDFRCMKQIEVNEVYEKIQNILMADQKA